MDAFEQYGSSSEEEREGEEDNCVSPNATALNETVTTGTSSVSAPPGSTNSLCQSDGPFPSQRQDPSALDSPAAEGQYQEKRSMTKKNLNTDAPINLRGCGTEERKHFLQSLAQSLGNPDAGRELRRRYGINEWASELAQHLSFSPSVVASGLDYKDLAVLQQKAESQRALERSQRLRSMTAASVRNSRGHTIPFLVGDSLSGTEQMKGGLSIRDTSNQKTTGEVGSGLNAEKDEEKKLKDGAARKRKRRSRWGN